MGCPFQELFWGMWSTVGGGDVGWAVERAEPGSSTWCGVKRARVKPIITDLGQAEMDQDQRGLAETALDNSITALHQ